MSTSGGRTSGRSAWSNLDSALNARGSEPRQVRVLLRGWIHHDTCEKECVGYWVTLSRMINKNGPPCPGSALCHNDQAHRNNCAVSENLKLKKSVPTYESAV